MQRAHTIHALAVACMMLAIAGIALAVWSGQQRVAIQGPWALAALPDGQVWLSVDAALWRFDGTGRRQAVVPLAEAGLDDKVAVLMPHPAGGLAAWVRGSSTLHLLDGTSAAPRSHIVPEWPADLSSHGTAAITFAFAPDGRVAIASGGGHAVVLFAADGRFLARTPADTYRFTNGLWWSPTGWWTTDTNRPALVRLDDASLQPVERIELRAGAPMVRYFLNMAAASHGAPVGSTAPLGTVARVGNGMTFGHVVDVFPDGSEQAFPLPLDEDMDLRALAWHDGRLLVVDGNGFAVRRYSAQRQWLGDWGDATAQDELTASHAAWQGWQQRYRWGLYGGGGLLLLGLLLVRWQQRLQAAATLAELPPEQAPPPAGERGIPGQPVLAAGERTRRLFKVLAPNMGILVLLMVASNLFLRWLAQEQPGQSLLPLLMGGMCAALVIVLWLGRRQARTLQTAPEHECLNNHTARSLLARPELFWPHREAGEVPRESLVLAGLRGHRWLVLTSQRLLLFKLSGTDARLHAIHPRSDVRGAQALELSESRRWFDRLIGFLAPGLVRLKIGLRNGEHIDSLVQSAQAARRLAHVLDATRVARRKVPSRRTASGQTQRDWRPLLASLLVPGLGQRLQGRGRTALALFVAWAVASLQWALVCWAWWVSLAEVPAYAFVLSITLFVLVYLVAVFDAWHMATEHART